MDFDSDILCVFDVFSKTHLSKEEKRHDRVSDL